MQCELAHDAFILQGKVFFCVFFSTLTTTLILMLVSSTILYVFSRFSIYFIVDLRANKDAWAWKGPLCCQSFSKINAYLEFVLNAGIAPANRVQHSLLSSLFCSRPALLLGGLWVLPLMNDGCTFNWWFFIERHTS